MTTLCGYAIGVPEKVEEGVFTLKVTRCEYAFSKLYQQKAQAFAAAEAYPCIPPEEIKTCGAKWFLYAFNMRADSEEFKNVQLYYLWNQFTSSYLERHCRDMSTFDDRRPTGPAGVNDGVRWRYYLLLDEDRELIGYSKLSSAD